MKSSSTIAFFGNKAYYSPLLFPIAQILFIGVKTLCGLTQKDLPLVGKQEKIFVVMLECDRLRFAIHPGTAEGGFRPALTVSKSNGEFPVNILEQIDFSNKTWQTVDVAIDDIAINGVINGFRLAGSFRGTFYVDDIHLVASRISEIPTVINEKPSDHTHTALHLETNFPNPFNSSTTLTYHVGLARQIQLVVYNMRGQKNKNPR